MHLTLLRDPTLISDELEINLLHTAVHHRTIDSRMASTFKMKYKGRIGDERLVA